MWRYLKYLFQLLLAPGHGWADISYYSPDPAMMQQKGLYPLTAVAAVTEFTALIYENDVTFQTAFERAVITFGAYFVSIFIARIIFDSFLPKMISGDYNPRKVATLNVCAIGLMVMIRILENCLPANLTLVSFLPLLVVIVIYKGSQYMAVKPDSVINYLCMGACATIVVPLIIYYALGMIVS